MRRLIGFFVKLVLSVICFVGITAVLVVFDGLNDVGDSADVALVIGRDDGTHSDAQLERVADLYKDGKFHHVIVSVPSDYPSFDAKAEMTKYLEEHHVPSSAIIEDSGAEGTAELAHDIADVMGSHEFTSVMIVTDYYRMSLIKLALLHAGVSNIAKSHVGSVNWQDAWPIARQIEALYSFLFHTFVMPAAEKIKSEASTEASKASAEAEKAKDSVDKKLDTLPR